MAEPLVEMLQVPGTEGQLAAADRTEESAVEQSVRELKKPRQVPLPVPAGPPLPQKEYPMDPLARVVAELEEAETPAR